VHWTEFLEFATNGDKELQRYLQLAAGYTLTGDRSHECLFLVYGPAGSGKSTFLEVLGTLLGEYYLPMESDVMVETVGTKSSTEYHMAQLMGRRMIGISEWPEGRKTKEDAIKRLTGDTMITGRHPGERPFQFESQAKLWVGTNVRPQISERAMWRRIRAINFNHVPEKPDPGLKSYLMNPDGALPAVLSWAVEGAVMLLSSGKRSPLAVGESRHVAEATEQYRISEDRFGMFLEEETKPSPGGAVRVLDLFDYYKAWIEQRGEHPPRMMTVVRMLEEKGERVSGMGNKVLLHDRVLVPRLVAAGHDVDPSWSDLVNRSR
jgi:putative DNA primase/helicase